MLQTWRQGLKWSKAPLRKKVLSWDLMICAFIFFLVVGVYLPLKNPFIFVFCPCPFIYLAWVNFFFLNVSSLVNDLIIYIYACMFTSTIDAWVHVILCIYIYIYIYYILFHTTTFGVCILYSSWAAQFGFFFFLKIN